MATTTQKPHPSQMDPRLRRAVYAKYREMLVSKNSQANEIIKQLPAYMVHQDHGFHRNAIANDVPPPPPPISGSVPAKRIQTQMSEAPACVQNAMMTKDKKPFTYTPGGIDLSQIKSPRMAKRVQQNANSPGVQPKVSPLARNSNDGNSSPAIQMQSPQTPQSGTAPPPPPPPPSMGSLAMGMPFQVFPTGPAMKNNQQLSAPQTNGNTRKSPQSFEPPPMGCRPEIKIPANPMAILKPAPRPQPKGDFWVQEYQQEKARDSIPSEDEARQQFVSSPIVQQYQQQPPPAPTQKQMSPIRYAQRSQSPEQRDFSGPIRNVQLEDTQMSRPVQGNQSPRVINQSPQLSSLPSPATPAAYAKQVIMEPIQAYNQPQSYQQQPSLIFQPTQNYQQQAQSYQQTPHGGKIILSTMPNKQHLNAQQHLGSLYIPPPMSIDDKDYLLSQQSPPWMSSKSNANDTPEWVNRDEVDSFIQQARMMQTPPSAGPNEHVIPISFERSPNKTPATPSFGPTPFYGAAQQQFNNVVSPKVDPHANQFVNQGYNDIDFPQVQQGPKTVMAQTQKPQQHQSQQPAGTRIIPIKIEGSRSPQQDQTVIMQSDPRSQPSPRMNAGGPNQSRSFKMLQHVTNTFDENSDNEEEDQEQQRLDNEPMREQQPLYSRPLGPDEMNENQMRRMQLSESDRAFMSRVKNQVDEEIYLHSESDPRYKGSAIPSKAFKVLQIMTDGAPNNVQSVPVGRQRNNQDDNVEQQNREPHLYQGGAIPSRSFKILQSMTQPENAADSNDNSDIEGNPLGNPLNYANDQSFPFHHHYAVPPMIPPPMIPPQYYYDWYDPQNNPYLAYYYQGYDPNCFGYAPPHNPNHSRSQTPQPSMTQNIPSVPNGNVPYYPYPYPPPPFMWYPPFMGFRPISASRETTPCFSENERFTKTPTTDDRNRRAVSCTPTCCQHAKPFMVEESRNKFNTVEEPLINFTKEINQTLPAQPERSCDEEEREENPLNCDKSLRRSLKSIPSVSNINLYSEENGDMSIEELKANPIIEEDEQSEYESEDENTEVEEDISQDTTTADFHYPHQLSVIYEENENNERRSSLVSRSSTLSDCSTTLMEEDNISVDYSGDEMDEENSNSVTVRLPLKFSFTRSKDNLVNTTLVVGESESDFGENSSSIHEHLKSPTPPDLPSDGHVLKSPSFPEAISNGCLSKDSSAPDVSVTFRLKSKSKSKTPERIITPVLSLVNNGIDSDPDCSVSISLPKRAKSKDRSIIIPEKLEEKSENSNDNKKNIDSSLYTSLDALEEIKRGMAEITNSLCSKICTLRKSALNIPANDHYIDPYRSSSTSQIESIDTDSEADLSLSYDDYHEDDDLNQQRKQSIGEKAFDLNDGDFTNQMEAIEDLPVVKDEADEEDYWGKLSSANKFYEEPIVPSKRSSRYWFDDDNEEKSQEEVHENEDEKHEEENQLEKKKVSDDFDFWKNYDEDKQIPQNQVQETTKVFIVQEKEICVDEKVSVDEIIEESEYEYEEVSEVTEEFEANLVVKDEKLLREDRCNDNESELASDEEWTEEEVEETEDEELQIKLHDQNVTAPVILNEIADEESEYEEESYETDPEENKEVFMEEKASNLATTEIEAETDNDEEISGEESEDEMIPDSKRDSLSRISKGRSLVNVSSYSSRDKVPSQINNTNQVDESEESDYDSADEAEFDQYNQKALPKICSNLLLKHSNDDCNLLTNVQTSHDDEVLLPELTTNRSNMTSESGISFEQNDADSEDGYEEDSEDDAPIDDEKTVTKESLSRSQEEFEEAQDEDQNEVKVNVKGKISMFERAISEEPVERSVKETPKVSSKYSFKHRESSEPPQQKPPVFSAPFNSQRASSEIKEIPKNQKLLDLINQRKTSPPTTETEEDKRKSVKERISSFEENESDASEKRETFKRYGNSKKSIPLVRSIDESCEEDSGVNSDFCKQFSENETDSENFPELRKLSRYQRASTHSRLFKLLQGDEEEVENSENREVKEVAEAPIPYKPKKIIHNVSVTRRQNPKAALEAETMDERRQRLCLPLSHQSSSGAESMSSSTTPSPTPGVINEKLVNELVQSLLSQKKGRAFKNLPIEKLHAAAVKILQEDMESNGTLSSADESTIPTVDSTPALTPQEFRHNSSYAEYYESWDNGGSQLQEEDLSDLNLIQSKAFKNLQEQQITANKKLWSVRCPRILSSKSINKDLARLSEVRESESPEPNHSHSPSSYRSMSKEPMSGENTNIKQRQMAKNCNT